MDGQRFGPAMREELRRRFQTRRLNGEQVYLDQTHLDSSFFRLEDPFRGRKSQDAMRFFTGLDSERLSELETELYRTIDE